MSEKKALILGGGAIKGAFQAGVVSYLLKEGGYIPDFIYGISVGSLNGAFIANEAGRQYVASGTVDYPEIGELIFRFWEKNVTSPNSLFKKQSPWLLLNSLRPARYKGFLDPKPFEKMIRDNTNIHHLNNSPVDLQIAAVDLQKGNLKFVKPTSSYFQRYLQASASIPLIMPLVRVQDGEGGFFTDGGLCEVSPVKKALEENCFDVLTICCQYLGEGESGMHFNKLSQLSERFMHIILNQIQRNDVELVKLYNSLLPPDGSIEASGPLKGMKTIAYQTISPANPIQLDISRFNSLDVKRLLRLGYETAEAAYIKPDVSVLKVPEPAIP